jgi:hypothetical protein
MLEEAKKRALRLLDRRDMSKKELIDKLIEKGESPEDAHSAASRMEELGLLSDERYAAMVARHYASKGYGRRRIEAELHRRAAPALGCGPAGAPRHGKYRRPPAADQAEGREPRSRHAEKSLRRAGSPRLFLGRDPGRRGAY